MIEGTGKAFGRAAAGLVPFLGLPFAVNAWTSVQCAYGHGALRYPVTRRKMLAALVLVWLAALVQVVTFGLFFLAILKAADRL